MHKKNLLLITFIFTIAVFIGGCRTLRPLLYDVSINLETISPNADGIDDVARFSYKLSSSADLSIYLIDAQGEKHYFRDSRRRSTGDYRVDFGGVIDGAMLPNGDYTWVVLAVGDDGETVQVEGTLRLQNADTTRPELQGFSVYPKDFTPNRDGINDRVTVNYYLTKKADVQVYLIAPDGETRYPIEEKERDVEPGDPGFHTYDMKAVLIWGLSRPPTVNILSALKRWTRWAIVLS